MISKKKRKNRNIRNFFVFLAHFFQIFQNPALNVSQCFRFSFIPDPVFGLCWCWLKQSPKQDIVLIRLCFESGNPEILFLDSALTSTGTGRVQNRK